jgi:hypothetical protein
MLLGVIGLVCIVFMLKKRNEGIGPDNFLNMFLLETSVMYDNLTNG